MLEQFFFILFLCGTMIFVYGLGETFGDMCWKCELRMENSRRDVKEALDYRFQVRKLEKELDELKIKLNEKVD